LSAGSSSKSTSKSWKCYTKSTKSRQKKLRKYISRIATKAQMRDLIIFVLNLKKSTIKRKVKMSLKLELIALEFPIGYSIDLVKSFIASYDKIKFNEKLHFKGPETQIIL